MKVLVVGAGAVGGWFGAKLAAAGHEVTFVARREHGAAIREHGLRVESPAGEVIGRGAVLEDVGEARGLGADLALVAVKSSALAQVGEATGAALAKDGVAIPLQNGLDAERELAALIGADRVIGGVAQLAGELVGPGHVRLRAGGMMVIAPLDPSRLERTRALARELDTCFPCGAEPDLERVLWQKLLWNSPFNAICALTRLSAGDVLAIPELERLVRDAMHEVVSVARAEGVELSEQAIDPLIAITLGMFRDTEPSMLQDVRAARRTERDALQGAVLHRADRHGVPAPVHRTLYALLTGLDARAS